MLTKRQKDMYDFIREYYEENGEGPKIAEIAEGIGIASHGSTHKYVNALIESGYLKRLPNRTRGLIPTEQANIESLVMPLMGKIAAGRLIEAVPDESTIDIGELLGGKGRYVLKVSGESMTGKGIMPGDYVVVETGREEKHGDIIVALVDGYDATLKTLLINTDKTVTLMPANDDFEPLTLDPKRLSIQGIVVGQLRSYP